MTITPGGNPVCEDCGRWYGPGVEHVCEPPECENHKEVQHRDGNPPWCNSCGWRHMVPAKPARKIKDV